MLQEVHERSLGVVRMVDDADAVHHVELPAEVHRREVGIDERDVATVLCPLPRDVDGIQVDTGDALRERCREADVLSAPAAAVQHVLPAHVLERVRCDPLAEQPLLPVVDALPLPCPCGLLRL